jgi:hypothetical protein
MSWTISGQPFTGNVVTVGTGKTYATISAVLSAIPTGDILILYYNGSEGVDVDTSSSRAVYIKGMVGGASIGTIGAGSAVNIFGFEDITFSYAGAGTSNQDNGFFNKCISSSGSAFWITTDGDTSSILISNCTATGATIVTLGNAGRTAPNTRVVKSQCAPQNPPSTYPAIFGIIESADYVTTATVGYGAGYGDDYILEVDSIAVTPANTSVHIGHTQQYSAIATMSDNSTQDITSFARWTSSNNAQAAIDSSGLATAISHGSVTITATFGVNGTATLQILPVVSIAVTPSTAHIFPLQSVQYSAIATMSDGATENVTGIATWASTNIGVATISSGFARGVNPGTITITATVNGVIGSSTLIVDVPQPHTYLSWSDDGGHTWSSDYPASIGTSGQRKIRAQWRRLGYSRDRVFRIMCADKIKKRIIGCIVE